MYKLYRIFGGFLLRIWIRGAAGHAVATCHCWFDYRQEKNCMTVMIHTDLQAANQMSPSSEVPCGDLSWSCYFSALREPLISFTVFKMSCQWAFSSQWRFLCIVVSVRWGFVINLNIFVKFFLFLIPLSGNCVVCLCTVDRLKEFGNRKL